LAGFSLKIRLQEMKDTFNHRVSLSFRADRNKSAGLVNALY